jgi:RHH-type proline utilization regulon transcriptional repressor/proline dehydrogenase/delta 1-pyrroline-5-carboxylate dehydrogenase
LPIPAALFPGRLNSGGYDLADDEALDALGTALDDKAPGREVAAQQVSREGSSSQPSRAPLDGSPAPGAGTPSNAAIAIRNPADRDDIVGAITAVEAADVGPAAARAVAAAPAWAAVPVDDRAALLERWADALERERLSLYGLMIREAGKTARNAVAELREAVDFCRYYAAQARRGLQTARPLGPIVCISPWNFPLAIFVGQVAAALVAGNPVLAKPAEQTPLVAREAVRLGHEAGIAANVLQLLPGPGETVGAALVADRRIAGVVFTGSTAVAKGIARTLAARADDPVLIAETGGLNAMIVDSSALPEQVVADVVESAFDSAGQRCSALRILCLQEDAADRVLEMLEGAMRELRVGSPLDLATDVGPVIDAEALAGLAKHVETMRANDLSVRQGALGPDTARGTFLAPTLIEVPSLNMVRTEVFGPVLHVVRFPADQLDRLVGDLNAAGYGLTHGVHTRIDETIAAVSGAVRAGNVYVNRNMVGAVVGSQPFGGEGLSGTGPKAGGPFYLARLATGSAPPWDAAPDPLHRLPLQPSTGSGASPRRAARPQSGRPSSPPSTMREQRRSAAARSSCPGPTGELNTLRLHPARRNRLRGPHGGGPRRASRGRAGHREPPGAA